MQYILRKVETLPATYVAGTIYYVDDTRQIAVADTADKVTVYGGNIVDATFVNNILTITKATGGDVVVDLSDVASATDVAEKLSALTQRVNKNAEDIEDIQSEIGSLPSTSTVQAMIDAAVASVLVYKGVKPTYNDLPKTGNKVGDTWNVIAGYGDTPPGTNWAWSGLAWDPLGGTIGTRAFFQTLVINGTTVPVADGTLRFATGTAKGTISINGVNVPINGLASAAYLAAKKLVGRITAQAQTPFINIQAAAAPQLTPDGTLQYNIQVGLVTASSKAGATGNGLATAADVRAAIDESHAWAEFHVNN